MWTRKNQRRIFQSCSRLIHTKQDPQVLFECHPNCFVIFKVLWPPTVPTSLQPLLPTLRPSNATHTLCGAPSTPPVGHGEASLRILDSVHGSLPGSLVQAVGTLPATAEWVVPWKGGRWSVRVGVKEDEQPMK